MKFGPLEYDLGYLIHEYKLRIVLLDCPYDTIDSKITQMLFGRIAALKINGYRREYPYGVLPVGTLDFIAQHLVVCEERQGELFPVIGMKTITLARCDQFNQRFPAYDLVAGHADDRWERAMHEFIDNAVRRNEPVAYASSLTADQAYRTNPVLKKFLWDVSALLFIRFFSTERIGPVISGSTVRFKVQEMTKFVGHEDLTLNGEPLPVMPCKPFFGEPVKLMALRKPPQEALDWAKQLDTLWQSRIVISAPDESIQAIA